MLVKHNKQGTWICFESVRELMLLSIAFGTVDFIPNEVINANIKEVGNKIGYEDTELIVEGLDAQSSKELMMDFYKKVQDSFR